MIDFIFLKSMRYEEWRFECLLRYQILLSPHSLQTAIGCTNDKVHQMISISFHTPHLPLSLNLDLASLRGGGSYPSQFYGETQEGREIYVRYRGGHLSVEQSDNDGRKTRLLETDIGPPHDGSMSLAQFCRYFGVTVNGKVPEETDPEARRYTDFSGATTYWTADFGRVTEQTSRRMLETCRKAWPEALLLEPVWNSRHELLDLREAKPDNIRSYRVWLVDGAARLSDIDTHPDEHLLPKEGQLQVSVDYGLWNSTGIPYGNSHLISASKELGRSIYVAGKYRQTDIVEIEDCAFKLRATFPTCDETPREKLSNLATVLLPHLPQTELERVNLGTGEVVSTFTRPIDPAIIHWCSQDDDRWIAVLKDETRGPWVGVRAQRA
ncbi:hypothetical protein [Roseibium sp.]|uniref:hypothetical protein n=1 Tax=Roseibium sp. TaxID=1936156 RepID=UPI003BAB1AF2